MQLPFDLVITTNSPGEMSTWVKPIIKAIRAVNSTIRIIVMILPCRFASGKEVEIAKAIDGVAYVLSSREVYQYILLNQLAYQPALRGCVLFLGGDLLFSVVLKWKFGYKAIAYTEGLIQYRRAFYRFYTRDIDGDLMLDSIEPENKLSVKSTKKKVMIILPGSRPYQFKHVLPLFLDAVKPFLNEWEIVVKISEHIRYSEIKLPVPHIGISFSEAEDNELFRKADFALTIPGTNNIMLSGFHVPALIVVPLNFTREVYLDGFAGFILNLPVLRNYPKQWILRQVNKKIKFLCLVNRKEGRLIYPELREMLTAEWITERIRQIFDTQEYNDISERLAGITPIKGVKDKIVRDVFELAFGG